MKRIASFHTYLLPLTRAHTRKHTPAASHTRAHAQAHTCCRRWALACRSARDLGRLPSKSSEMAMAAAVAAACVMEMETAVSAAARRQACRGWRHQTAEAEHVSARRIHAETEQDGFGKREAPHAS